LFSFADALNVLLIIVNSLVILPKSPSVLTNLLSSFVRKRLPVAFEREVRFATVHFTHPYEVKEVLFVPVRPPLPYQLVSPLLIIECELGWLVATRRVFQVVLPRCLFLVELVKCFRVVELMIVTAIGQETPTFYLALDVLRCCVTFGFGDESVAIVGVDVVVLGLALTSRPNINKLGMVGLISLIFVLLPFERVHFALSCMIRLITSQTH